MRLQAILNLVLGFVFTAHALRFNSQITPQDVQLNLKDFLITNVYAHSFSNSAATTWNRTLSFLFTDPNSNTSSICTTSWAQSSSNSSGPPLTYSLCDYTGVDETFQWHFLSFSSLKKFSIEFMHGWSDPADFPPPYEYVGMFSKGNNFNLTCIEGNGLQGCHLPQPQSPYHAKVNALTN